MDVHIPMAHSLPPHKVANRDHTPRMPPSRKRNFQITTDTEPNPKKRRVQGKREGQRQASHPTPVVTPLKNTSQTDALVPPDVKPDIKPDVKPLDNSNNEESFATSIAKGRQWILIDEYPKPNPPGNIKSNPMISTAPPPDLKTTPLRNQAIRTVAEHSITTVATTKDIANTPNYKESRTNRYNQGG
jgi:hypothetical protein